MTYYIIAVILFVLVVIFYSILISKGKHITTMQKNLNKSMGEYFILLSEFEKIIKEENLEIKKEKVNILYQKAKLYCEQFPNSSYKKDIEKLKEKLENLIDQLI